MWLSESIGAVVFGCIGVVGAFGGVWASISGHRVSTTLRIRDIAEKLDRDALIASAELRANEANAKAEVETLGRLKIEAQLAPRMLGEAQRARIAERMRPFGELGWRQSVAVFSSVSSSESSILVNHLSLAFRAAGWDVNDRRATYGAHVDGTVGVGVVFSADYRAANVVNALIPALKNEGLLTYLIPIPMPASIEDDPAHAPWISVVVGSHP
jgi:hypothetical protein